MAARVKKIRRPRPAKRAKAAAAAAPTTIPRPKADWESPLRMKRKASGLTRLPRRLTALS